METIIMTVGTSMLTNPDRDLPEAERRPWVGQKSMGDTAQALAWLEKKFTEDSAALEQFSAETNTFWRLDPKTNDEIILLHSDTPTGLECAQVLQGFFTTVLGQENLTLRKLPEINYDLDEQGSALEKMAELLKTLVDQAQGNVTLAATGGFKAQTMIMGILGNALNLPVCYVHEQYRALIYLPFLTVKNTGVPRSMAQANLPESSKPRSEVVMVQESKPHHRPKVWKKLEKRLTELPWVEFVRFDQQAFGAPKNGVKQATRGMPDGRHVFWMHLHESDEKHMAISVETTGYTPEHSEHAARVLREELGRLLS